MTSAGETLATERIEAARYRALEPFPGRVSLRWLLECTECGEQQHLRPDTKLKPCQHKQRRADEASVQRYLDALLAVRTQTLGTKNLRALEDHPGGEGELWWVQCKYCGRAWHMREDQLRACPHKGTGDPGHPPLPDLSVKVRTKPTPAPPAAEDMAMLPGLVGRHAYLVESGGQWTLRVGRFMYVPKGPADEDSLLYAALGGPSVEEAEHLLRDAGWSVGPQGWNEEAAGRFGGYLYTEVTSPLLTEYAVGREVLGSQARTPEKTGQAFLKRTQTAAAGMGRDVHGREWPLYWRAEVEALRGAGLVRPGEEPTP